jgi:hypothetical protein
MTALFPRRTKPTEVNPKRVKRLGSVGGTTYYEIDGDEYVPMGWAATVDDARDGELLVKVDERVFDERGQFHGGGLEVPPAAEGEPRHLCGRAQQADPTS